MLKQQFEQIQPVISTLFDLQTVNLTSDPIKNTSLLLQVAIQYGRKLIQITERLDQFRSRSASVHQTQTFNRILDLYKQCGWREEGNQTQEFMIQKIRFQLRKGNESKKSLYSKNQTKRSKKQVQFGKKDITFLKDGIKKDEVLWKQIFMKIQTISQKYNQEMKFQNNAQFKAQEPISFCQILKYNMSINLSNLDTISQFLSNLMHSLPNIKNSKVNNLIKLIQQRQTVFSYSMSKLLESIRVLKNPMNRNVQQAYDNITSLISKLFDIYPSAHLLKSLELKEQPNVLNIKQYLNNCKQIQCNIKVQSKKDAEIKNLNMSFYRFRLKVQQVLKKLQHVIKTKRSLDNKQADKFIQQFKEAVIYNDTESNYEEINNFEQQLKMITSRFEHKQTQFREELQRNLKKASKSLQVYEQQLKSLKIQITKTEAQTQKLTKNLDSSKAQNTKLKQKSSQYQKIVSSLQNQLQKTKNQLKSQHKQQIKQQKVIKAEYDYILKQKKQNETEHKALMQKLKLQQKLFDQQRGTFITKVKIMQTKYEQSLYENTQVKQSLQQMIETNKLLKSQNEQLMRVHEQKIQQCQAVVNQYTTLQKQYQVKQAQFKDLKIQNSSFKSTISELQKQNQQLKDNNSIISKQRQFLMNQCQKYREFGRLNQDDIDALKQQFQKLHKSYLQVQSQNSYLKNNLQNTILQHTKVVEIQQRCNGTIFQKETEIKHLKRQLCEFQEQNKFLKEEARIKQTQFEQLVKNSQTNKDQKKQASRLKRQITQVRNSLATSQLQYSVAKKQLQNMIHEQQTKKQVQKVDIKSVSAKYQLQIDSLKIDIKNKKEVWDREKQNYQRQKDLLVQKVEDLNALLEEKQILSQRLKVYKH